jgi:hypothetical protein
MNIKTLLTISTLGLIVYFSGVGCARLSRASQQQQQFSASGQSEKLKSVRPARLDGQFSVYVTEARNRFYREQFLWLEEEASRLRASKDRFPGGYWKLNALYTALGNPEGEESASEEDWEKHLAILRNWVKQQPRSLTAIVGLGDALINYGWKARGTGRAAGVGDAEWRLYNSRMAEAEQVLNDARWLSQQCPHWYVAMLRLGQSTGWDARRFNKLFAEAVKLEPTYYYYYRIKATYLMPRWYGEPGDWEKFATESARQVGGDEGDIIFFLIYTHMLGMHDITFMSNPRRAAWPQILAGFRALEKHYGVSPQHLNEACFLAFLSMDRQVAAELFERIGEQYDASVWRSRSRFELFRTGALRDAAQKKD